MEDLIEAALDFIINEVINNLTCHVKLKTCSEYIENFGNRI